jgi:hypothetical protein
MIASAHFAAGTVVGMASAHFARSRFAQVAIAFGTGVAVHLLMDAVPHSDYELLPTQYVPFVIVGEGLVVLVFAFMALRNRVKSGWRPAIVAGVLGSALPDAKFIAPYLLPTSVAGLIREYGNRLHEPFHASAAPALLGMVTQVSCTILLLGTLALFPRSRA